MIIEIFPDNYNKVKDYIKGICSFVGFGGDPTKMKEIYYGGISIESIKNHPWEKEFDKRQILLQIDLVNESFRNKLIKLAKQ